MPRKKAAATLSNLEKMQAELAAKIKATKDRIAAEAKAVERHKAQLVGAVILRKMAAGDGSHLAGIVLDELEKTLTKTSDRYRARFAPITKPSAKPKKVNEIARNAWAAVGDAWSCFAHFWEMAVAACPPHPPRIFAAR